MNVHACVCNNVHVHACTNMHVEVHGCVNTHVYVYVHVCVCMCMHVYVCMFMCACMCVCTHVYVYVHVYVRVCEHAYVCMYTVCACVCVCVCVYVCQVLPAGSTVYSQSSSLSQRYLESQSLTDNGATQQHTNTTTTQQGPSSEQHCSLLTHPLYGYTPRPHNQSTGHVTDRHSQSQRSAEAWSSGGGTSGETGETTQSLSPRDDAQPWPAAGALPWRRGAEG